MMNSKLSLFSIGILMLLATEAVLYATTAAANRVEFKQVAKKHTDSSTGVEQLQQEQQLKISKKILIAIIVRNNAYSFPTFLASLESLKCPNKKEKCDLWVIFDNCSDQSQEMFTYWLGHTRMLFDSIIMLDTKNDEATRQKHPELDEIYFSKNLKKRAIKYAIDRKFTYLFFINADIILTNPYTIGILIEKRKSFVAPLLTSAMTKYSTFWTLYSLPNETRSFATREYLSIYNREKKGCFKAIGLHDCFLLNLNDSKVHHLLDENFNRNIQQNLLPIDYDIDLNNLAIRNNLLMHVCNREQFGYIPDPIYNNETDRSELFTQLRLEHLLNGPNKTYLSELPITKYLDAEQKYNNRKHKSRLGFDQIYVINLERRGDRLERIRSSLDDLNINFRVFKAIDAKEIDENYLKMIGVKVIPKYEDPYSGRPINYGEIGCFLSHYFIWQEMVDNNYEQVLVLEDDAQFAFHFKKYLKHFMNEMKRNQIKWDLLYLGRKVMQAYSDDEYLFEDGVKSLDDHILVYPSYTHWTVAYALSLEGAKKLLKQNPLTRLMPVDEYLPLMFNKQPNEYWNGFYKERDLVALAIYPSIISPTHYTGEPNHVSDTEQTQMIDMKKFESNLIIEKNDDESKQNAKINENDIEDEEEKQQQQIVSKFNMNKIEL